MSAITDVQKDIQPTIVEQYEEDEKYEQKDQLYSTKKYSNVATNIAADVSNNEKSFLARFLDIFINVISILDSISNISFIILLFYYTKFTNDEFQNTEKITDFLMILAIGNIISAAIGIAEYTVTNKIATNYTPKKNALRVVFFVLSPCLPAWQWILEQIQNGEDSLVIPLEYDELLIWSTQKLQRDDVFLIKCVFESCFQIIIQFFALSQLQGYHTVDIYLYISIVISFILIMSQFILVSYNSKRSMIYSNMLAYSMDLLLSLIFGIFIGSFVFQQIFTAIGLYMSLELLIFIPFYIYRYVNLFSFSPWLYIPVLLICWYPMMVFVLYAFTIYPSLIYLYTQPNEIGKKKLFHDKLYEYCCDSKNANEFNLKLVVINYNCIRSYVHTLREADDEKYYQFVNKLYHTSASELSTDYLSEFDEIIHDRMNSNSKVSKLINVKMVQIFIRTILVICCVMLDVFYLKSFTTGSAFMNQYSVVITSLGVFGIIIFFIWIVSVIFEVFISNWNSFCYYMIASKHDRFVLLQTIEEFQEQCDNLLKHIQKDDHK